ncbi:MAG TPA: hypothetical protein VEB20_18855 [Azospirillaceae bacterium]|nr:hypothetical protein [Azospirillaceae bacterium]
MSEGRRNIAIAIKRCLDNLAVDARRGDMHDLEHFLELASMAAEDAARAADPRAMMIEAMMQQDPCGHC